MEGLGWYEKVEDIEKHGIRARGKSELIKHLAGRRLTRNQGIVAKCYDCMGYFSDGAQDCLQPDCPLYEYFPYKRKDGDKGQA